MQTGINIDSYGISISQAFNQPRLMQVWHHIQPGEGGVWFAPQLLLCRGVMREDPEADGPRAVEGALVCEYPVPQTLMGLSYTCSGCGLRGATTWLTHTETII